MNYILIRRILGILVIICGLVSFILIFHSSTKIAALGNITVNTGTDRIFKDIIVNGAAIFLKGLACGILGICLALGAMVYKIGGGKEVVTFDIKEDKVEAAIKYGNSTTSKQEMHNIGSAYGQSVNISNSSNTIKAGKNLQKDNPSNKGMNSRSRKRNLIIIVSCILLFLNFIFVVLFFTKK